MTMGHIVTEDTDTHPMPVVDEQDPDRASLEYSKHRTKLSTHRTRLSENRSELSTRRTGLSFQRTRMSAERTLMGVIRTSLALISFGFTIFQFFRNLQEKQIVDIDSHAARNFGMVLIYIGVAMNAVGIFYHLQFMWGLRKERRNLSSRGLLHADSTFPISFTLVIAFLLLLIGVAAVASVTFRVGPLE